MLSGTLLLFWWSSGCCNLIPGSSAFSKTSLNIWKFTVHILLNLAWRILSITLLASVKWVQLCGSLSILWHCLSLGLEWKLTFSMASRRDQWTPWSQTLRLQSYKVPSWLHFVMAALGKEHSLRIPSVLIPWTISQHISLVLPSPRIHNCTSHHLLCYQCLPRLTFPGVPAIASYLISLLLSHPFPTSLLYGSQSDALKIEVNSCHLLFSLEISSDSLQLHGLQHTRLSCP